MVYIKRFLLKKFAISITETKGKVKAFFKIVLNSKSKRCIMKVPIGSVDLYKKALEWKEFENIVEYDNDIVENITLFSLDYNSSF